MYQVAEIIPRFVFVQKLKCNFSAREWSYLWKLCIYFYFAEIFNNLQSCCHYSNECNFSITFSFNTEATQIVHSSMFNSNIQVWQQLLTSPQSEITHSAGQETWLQNSVVGTNGLSAPHRESATIFWVPALVSCEQYNCLVRVPLPHDMLQDVHEVKCQLKFKY